MLLPAVLLLIAQTIGPPSYWGSLSPGPHGVGFTQRWVIDSTLRLPKGEQYGLRYLAYRDAPRARGAFPVVVDTEGSQSWMDDNVVLCEYLASRGYVVVGSAFPGEDNFNFMTNSSDESHPRDIRRLLLELDIAH